MTWMADPRRQADRGPAVRGDSLLAVGLNYHVAVERHQQTWRVARLQAGAATINRLIDAAFASVGGGGPLLERSGRGLRCACPAGR